VLETSQGPAFSIASVTAEVRRVEGFARPDRVDNVDDRGTGVAGVVVVFDE
jgi:hypothetical protein